MGKNIISKLVILLLSIVLIQKIYSQEFEWAYDYAKYRLIYSFTLESDMQDVYVNISIPTSVIDNILQYCQAINKTFCDEAFPRVYYYNSSTGEQVQVGDVTYVVNYRGYPQVIRVYFSSLPAGTHYILIYYPYIWVEDFEDNGLYQQISNVGECFDDGWCVITASGEKYARIETNGWMPTTYRRLHLHASGYPSVYIVLKREVNISINISYPIIIEYDVSVSAPSETDSWIGFEFLLKDGSKITLKYKFGGVRNYVPSNLNICGTVPTGQGHIITDILKDLSMSCGISVNNIDKLSAIYIVMYGYDIGYGEMYIDNIRVITGYP